MPYLSVLGHANLDVIIRVASYPGPGVSVPVLGRKVVRGGTGANIAYHAAGLGVPTRLWARVGADFPMDWRDALEAAGVDLSWMDVVADALTPTCTILSGPDGEQAFCMDQGPMDAMANHPPASGILDDLAWLHVGTGDPRGFQALAEEARAKGVKVAFDPAQEIRFQYDSRTFEKLLDTADVFFCNHHELDVALKFLSYGDPVQLLDHVDAIVVTRGKEGASLITPKGRVDQPAFEVEAADPTGAGDALRAGWYAGLHAGRSMEDALAWGQAAAALAVQFEGGQGSLLRMSLLEDMVGSHNKP